MTSRGEPPALATWLLARLALGERSESLAGDLIEHYRDGRSATWFWRQTLSAIASGFTVELWHHKVVAVFAVGIVTYANELFMFIMRPRWMWSLDAWYRFLINWLLWMEWDTARHLAYHVLSGLTGEMAWCAFVSGIAWMLTRLSPRQRGLIVTLLVATWIGQLALPAFSRSLVVALSEPRTPMWFVDVLRFFVFAFVAAPVSIYLGGLHGAKDQDRFARGASATAG